MDSWRMGGAVALALIGLTVGAAMCLTGNSEGDVGWLGSCDDARSIARKTGKPLFVAFR
jgi:hypothetical protein